MYIHPDAVINTFVDVKIPDASELMKRFGLKTPQGHPDRISDDVYSTPSNLHDVDPASKYLHQFNQMLNLANSAVLDSASAEEKTAENSELASEESSDVSHE